MSKHRRESRRILNNALGANEASILSVISKVNESLTVSSFNNKTRRAMSVMLCIVIILTSITITLGLLPKAPQEHDSILCTHICDDRCFLSANDREGSIANNFAPAYKIEISEIDASSFDYMQAAGVVIKNINESGSGANNNGEGIDITIRGPAVSNEQSLLPERHNPYSILEEAENEDNDADVDDSDPGKPDNDSVIIVPGIMTTEQPSAVQEHKTYILTIIVEGEDGMAVGSQSGQMLDENPLKPDKTYLIEGVYEGEMLTLVASPDNDAHFVHWQAYLTVDITQNFPLNSHYADPPMSIKNFIMPDADVTIMIEFSTKEPDVPDLPAYVQPKETEEDVDEAEDESEEVIENENQDENQDEKAIGSRVVIYQSEM